MKLNKMREQMAKEFINALEQDIIPWRQEWSSTSLRPYNTITNTYYRGGNALWLAMRGFRDPRWCTFNQASQKGWKIKKGSKGTLVEFWSLYDLKEKKTITFAEAEKIKEKDEEWEKRIRPTSRTFTVFNGEQIEGIPELKIEKKELEIGDFINKRDTLLKNMGVGFSEGHSGASYNVATDIIKMPNVQQFNSPYAYASTFLHESAHATSHESRLNRNVRAMFGTETYAKEELRAEISSAFTSQVLGIPNGTTEMDNHKAYIQSWISVLKNNPNELFAAIKEAEKISDYLIEKGEFEPCIEIIQEKEKEAEKTEQKIKSPSSESKKKFYTREESEKMSEWLKENLKIEDVCQSLGFTPVRVGQNYLTLKEHDSVRINTDKNCFFWNSSGTKGSVIDACMSLGEMDKPTAYNHLYDMVGGQETVYQYIYGHREEPTIQRSARKNEPPKEVPVEEIFDGVKLPQKGNTYKNVFAYLTKTRMISSNVVNEFVKKDMLYQDERNNCVFVSRNKEGTPVFACQRGTNTQKRFVADCLGNDYSKGFYIDNGADKLFVVEGVIDAMSKMSIMEKSGEDYHQYNFLAMSGTEKQESILNALRENENIKEVYLGLDNDAGGIKATCQINKLLEGENVKVTIDQPSQIGFDWNDALKSNQECNLWDSKKKSSKSLFQEHNKGLEL